MKIIIFGGSFNPVHREHVNMAEAAVAALGADRLIAMPTAVSPHKSGFLSASGEDRLKMCRLAFKHIRQAEVSDYELKNGGVSYSYITCEHFASKYPDDELYFLMGADMLESFTRWRYPERILACVKLAACAREDDAVFDSAAKKIEGALSTKIFRVPYTGDRVSSTRVRVLASLNEDISGYVNSSVCQYIEEKGIYSLNNLGFAKKLEKPSRWAHTVRVAVMCAENAKRVNLSEEQAITMAALHDCAKNLRPDSPYLKGFVPPDGVPEPVMHQYGGAYVAQNYFGVTDENLLNAIRYHTSGRPGMDGAETLLYLCDMLEEGRTFDGVEELRELFYRDLNLCLYEAIKRQVVYLKSTGAPVFGLTEKTYEYLKEKYNEFN
ncbi:MAG: nicotinate (nicotinamide) nucleotide adenylyltransferase [Candidatus Coproplasma sp.]